MFDMAKVKSVYSGRKGCACGCRGVYRYATAADQPSWKRDCVDVKPQTMQAMARKVDAFVRDGSNVARVMVSRDGDWFAVDMMNDRTYTVYFR